MRVFRAFILAVFLMPTTLLPAQEIGIFDKFMLWSECKPIPLTKEDLGLGDDAEKISLSKEAIETAIRSRMRAARIYSENTKNIFLYVNVIIVGNAFNITAELRKVATDQASSNIGWAATWDIGLTGTHGNNANFIISSVAQVTDKFIDEYLRVNEAACG